jgi:hypothetical protein
MFTVVHVELVENAGVENSKASELGKFYLNNSFRVICKNKAYDIQNDIF